jgi:hypothetical protein
MARKKRVFTAEECAFITREYGRTPSSQIAQKLGRRQSAISGKAHALGLGPLCLQRRFTPEEDALIRQDYAAFVPMDEIANKLGRSVSSVNNKIYRGMGSRRDSTIMRRVSCVPEHLKELAGKIPVDEWQAKYHSWQSAKCAEIDARENLTRREKMAAKQAAGMSLQAIGKQYSITRGRVHQILNYDSKSKIGALTEGNLEQYSLSAISALAERVVAALVPR